MKCVQLAVLKDGLCIAEDEVHMAFNKAVVAELAGRLARRSSYQITTGAAVSVKGILRTQKPDMVQHGAVGAEQQSHSL